MLIMLIRPIFSSCWDSPNIKCQHTASSPASCLELIQRRYLEQHIGSPDFLSTINGGVIKPVIEYQTYLDSTLLQPPTTSVIFLVNVWKFKFHKWYDEVGGKVITIGLLININELTELLSQKWAHVEMLKWVRIYRLLNWTKHAGDHQQS